jgi:Protease inhibitor Inh
MTSGHRGHTTFRLLAVPLLGLLSACNGTQDPYASGPWGRGGYVKPSSPLYAQPWNQPLDPSLVGPDTSAASQIRRAPADIMEPIGPWASRDVVPSDNDVMAEDPSVLASLPPVPTEGVSTTEPIMANNLPPQTEPRPQHDRRAFTSLTGQWTAQESGRSCHLNLSSTPALDLYKASAADCGNDALRNVNSWVHREKTLVLYARGRVTARLREDGDAFSGALEDTKTPIRISR